MRNKTRQSSNVGSTSGQESGTLEDVVVVGGVSIGVEVEHQVVVVVRIQMMDLYGAPPNRSVNRHQLIIVVVVVDCRLLAVVVDQLTIHYRKSHREYPSNDEDWPPERPELPSSRDHTTTNKIVSFFFLKCFSRAHKFKWIQVEEVKF